MCLIVIICLILVLIGLAGVGVSVYYLATGKSRQSSFQISLCPIFEDQQNYVPLKTAGVAVGGALALLAFCFLCCILACLGSRDGYFTYHGDSPRTGGRALALISPAHPNAHRYVAREYAEISEHRPTASFASLSTIARHKTTLHEVNGSSNTKNVTIEMPERLLTGRKVSPRTHEQRLSRVVHQIGYVVEDTKKRYHGEAPSKVIVKVDEKAKATV